MMTYDPTVINVAVAFFGCSPLPCAIRIKIARVVSGFANLNVPPRPHLDSSTHWTVAMVCIIRLHHVGLMAPRIFPLIRAVLYPVVP